ncbi:Uncharacterised protein [Mycobacteroides abscessus subsp. abscessus]|nr:Uncharacterised protein [Mycobacteroides abscessus subsp. abscessus]
MSLRARGGGRTNSPTRHAYMLVSRGEKAIADLTRDLLCTDAQIVWFRMPQKSTLWSRS